MDKNWLIRTKSNHILGPVSKEKVLELFHNGSIKPDDEVCCGNGFWFFIREEDMVESYLLGKEIQGFNPISEAKDTLISQSEVHPPETSQDENTLVGGVSIAMLSPQDQPPVEIPEVPVESELSSGLDIGKKKTEPKRRVKRSSRPKAEAPFKTQNYLKYLALLGFIILFALLFYRKHIISYFFKGEMTSISIQIIPIAHAQDEVPDQKKKLLDLNLEYGEVSFRPQVGMSGFRVMSTLNIEEITCDELDQDTHQLAVLLYPSELFNERFLIKMRDCVLKMSNENPLKRWLKSVANVPALSEKDQEKKTFLAEVLNSQFNLITDTAVKTRIVEILHDIPEITLSERMLKSFLYLIIGNIARSDNLLQEFIRQAPFKNWQGFSTHQGLYHRLGTENLEQILKKLAKHPTDRSVFQLFMLYLQNFYQEETLNNMVSNYSENDVEEKLKLRYFESIAPDFVRFMRLKNKSDNQKNKALRNYQNYSIQMQSFWIWHSLGVYPPFTDELINGLKPIEELEPLWFIYVMENERLSDMYFKKESKSFLTGRRQLLKKHLESSDTFMLALFKLIEFGDINQELVNKTASFLIHE